MYVPTCQKNATKFRESWLVLSEYKDWLKRDEKSESSAFCMLCKKSFNISNMGKTTLQLHANSERHKTIVKFCESQSSLFFIMPRRETKKATPESTKPDDKLVVVLQPDLAAQ